MIPYIDIWRKFWIKLVTILGLLFSFVSLMTDPQNIPEMKIILKMVLDFHNLDMKLMNEVLQKASE